MENAILDGNSYLRSSVILVQSLDDGQCEVDAGPILGVSAPVAVDRYGNSDEKLRQIAADRGKPPFRDELREVAEKNVENLKDGFEKFGQNLRKNGDLAFNLMTFIKQIVIIEDN